MRATNGRWTVAQLVMLAVLLSSVHAFSAAVTHDCLIEARQMIEIRSPVDGAIERVAVQRGDRVRKGQIIVELDTSTERAAAAVAQARLAAEGQLKSAQAQVEFASRKLARVRDLVEQNAMSKAELEQAEAEDHLAHAQLRGAQDGRDVAAQELRQAQTAIAEKRIRSPIEGVVVERFQGVGEIASRANQKPIVRIAQIDPLSVEVIRPVSEYGSIKRGMHAQVYPEQPGGRAFAATVEVVDRVIDAASGTFGVRLLMPNAKHEIPAGVKCRVQMINQ